MLAGGNIEEDSVMEVQEAELGSWVKVRRWGRRKHIREASPEMIHPNKYVKLRDVVDIS